MTVDLPLFCNLLRLGRSIEDGATGLLKRRANNKESKMQSGTGDAAFPLVIDSLLQFANEHAHQPLSPGDVEKLAALDSQFFVARVQGGFPTVDTPQSDDRLFGD